MSGTSPSLGEVVACCETIVQSKSPALNWAHNYAQCLIDMVDMGETEASALRSQVLYVRDNLSHWRGPVAREVRATLDSWLRAQPD